MTTQSYTDDQIETAIMGATFPNRLGEMLAYVFAERQRLQAEVEALRSTVSDVLELITYEDGEIVDEVNPCRIYDRISRFERATPNETKEAKS